MRLRNSCGSESNASSTTLTKCSRFILHPLTQIRGRSLRVAVVVLVLIILVIFFAVSFVFFLVGLLSKEDIGRDRVIRTVCDEALWTYSAHVLMVLCARWQEQRALSGLRASTGNRRTLPRCEINLMADDLKRAAVWRNLLPQRHGSLCLSQPARNAA
jgi:hypothetical protein